jgi:hypothetical protein
VPTIARADDLPEPVRIWCASEAPPAESLCNITNDLRDAYVIAERHATDIDLWGSALIREVVRGGRVGIDWYPESLPIRPGLFALYSPRSHMVYVARSLRDEPVYLKGALLAHELTHTVRDLHGAGAGLPPRGECLANELQAHGVGLTVYERLLREFGPAEHLGDAGESFQRDLDAWRASSRDGELSAQALQPVSLNHLFSAGYADSCSWLEEEAR